MFRSKTIQVWVDTPDASWVWSFPGSEVELKSEVECNFLPQHLVGRTKREFLGTIAPADHDQQGQCAFRLTLSPRKKAVFHAQGDVPATTAEPAPFPWPPPAPLLRRLQRDPTDRPALEELLGTVPEGPFRTVLEHHLAEPKEAGRTRRANSFALLEEHDGIAGLDWVGPFVVGLRIPEDEEVDGSPSLFERPALALLQSIEGPGRLRLTEEAAAALPQGLQTLDAAIDGAMAQRVVSRCEALETLRVHGTIEALTAPKVKRLLLEDVPVGEPADWSLPTLEQLSIPVAALPWAGQLAAWSQLVRLTLEGFGDWPPPCEIPPAPRLTHIDAMGVVSLEGAKLLTDPDGPLPALKHFGIDDVTTTSPFVQALLLQALEIPESWDPSKVYWPELGEWSDPAGYPTSELTEALRRRTPAELEDALSTLRDRYEATRGERARGLLQELVDRHRMASFRNEPVLPRADDVLARANALARCAAWMAGDDSRFDPEERAWQWTHLRVRATAPTADVPAALAEVQALEASPARDALLALLQGPEDGARIAAWLWGDRATYSWEIPQIVALADDWRRDFVSDEVIAWLLLDVASADMARALRDAGVEVHRACRETLLAFVDDQIPLDWAAIFHDWAPPYLAAWHALGVTPVQVLDLTASGFAPDEVEEDLEHHLDQAYGRRAEALAPHRAETYGRD